MLLEGKKAAPASTRADHDGSDGSNFMNKLFHQSSTVLAVLSPAALLIPQPALLPFDLVLGVVIPYHSHVALNYLVTDYVPKAQREWARLAIVIASLLTAGGILKLNLEGPGLTTSVKSLWASPSQAKADDHHH